MEENQSKKRRKWVENLSVLSSDDDEEYSVATKGKPSILNNDKVIYLRFPYYMGSDDSDDEESFNYFPSDSRRKSESKKTVSSSDEEKESSSENRSYKHTKRKVHNKKNKGDHQKSRSKDINHVNKSSVKERSKSSKSKGDNKQATKETTTLSQKIEKASNLTNCTNVIYENEKYEESVQNEQVDSNRFLDSSSEASCSEMPSTKPKRAKLRRVRVISTSASSSDEENVKRSDPPTNLAQPKSTDEDDQLKASHNLRRRVNPPTTLSSNDENYSDECTDVQSPGTKLPVNKLKINEDAWKSIAISDIKAQYNKPSKFSEYKRKLVTSNPSSVAICKQFQNREIYKNNSSSGRVAFRLKPNPKHPSLQKSLPTDQHVNESKCPTNTSQMQEPTLERATKNQIEDTSSFTNRSPALLGERRQRDSLTEDLNENAASLNASAVNANQSQLQCNSADTPLLDSDKFTNVLGAKIRHAHNKEFKDQSSNFVNNNSRPRIKITNPIHKRTQLPHENKPKESKQNLNEISPNCDVVGNIMSQMDRNNYKIQGPKVNKKPELTPEMLGWFPAGSNAFPIFGGNVQSSSSLQSANISENQTKHNLPIGVIPSIVMGTTSTTNNSNNPSYNPLSPIATISNAKHTNYIQRQAVFEVGIKENSKDPGFKPASKIDHVFNNSNSSNTIPRVPFVPFYSAPQEDYRDREFRIKNVIGNEKKNNSIFVQHDKSITDNSVNNNPLSAESKQTQILSPGGHNNFINQEQRTTDIPPIEMNKVLPSVDSSKNISQCVNVKNTNLNVKNTKLSLRKKSSNMTNVYRPSTEKEISLKASSQPWVPTVFPVGNGAIRREFRENSMPNNNNAPKGIRIRMRGTEFRLPSSHKITLPTKHSDHNGPATNESSTRSDSVVELQTDKSQKDERLGETEAATVESIPAVSSSSTTSSSSPDNSSSSTDDSSSESSDESGKSSSTDSSTVSDSTAKLNSPVLKDTTNTFDNSQLLSPTENVQSISVEGTQDPSGVKENITVQVTQNSSGEPVTQSSRTLEHSNNVAKETNDFKINCSSPVTDDNKYSETQPTKCINIDEVITLSSSDSDTNDQVNEKEIRVQSQEKFVGNAKPSGSKDGSLIEDSKPVSQDEQNQLNANKVGKIRVKSLKELGVFDNNPGIGNALQTTQTQAHGVSQTQRNQSVIESVSAKTREMVSEPDRTNSDTNVLPKMPQKPIHSQDVLVLPMRIVNGKPWMLVKPVNILRPTVSVSSLINNQRSNNQLQQNVGTANSCQGGSVPTETNTALPPQAVPSSSTESSGQEIRQNPPTVAIAMPHPSLEVETLFFRLCDELFTDTVPHYIPKLADDLHLFISYDIRREDRLKTIDQLTSPETILSEKRRIERETADEIRLRGQSFVPLFMTIMNRIDRDNLKALITAVYCRIVQQVERIDPINRNYRFKIRNIIKHMLLRHNSGVRPEVLAYFDSENDSCFLTNFAYIEDLLQKYDAYLEKREIAANQNNNTSGTSNPVVGTQQTVENSSVTVGQKETSNFTTRSTSAIDMPQSSHSRPSTSFQTSATAHQPPIGNLDDVFLKKNSKK